VNKLRCQLAKSIVLICSADLDRDILTRDVAGFSKAALERG
jgi:hypothetical protein